MSLSSSNRVNEFVDIDLSFKKNPLTGDVAKKLDENAIKQSVYNLLEFKAFDAKFHPEIEGGIRKLLFENMTPATLLMAEQLVRTVLSNFEPRISVDSVDVIPDYDSGAFMIDLHFTILNDGRQTSYKFYVYKAR